jgi:hypothetical protein
MEAAMNVETHFLDDDRPAGDHGGPWHIGDVLAEYLLLLPAIETEAAQEAVAAA